MCWAASHSSYSPGIAMRAKEIGYPFCVRLLTSRWTTRKEAGQEGLFQTKYSRYCIDKIPARPRVEERLKLLERSVNNKTYHEKICYPLNKKTFTFEKFYFLCLR